MESGPYFTESVRNHVAGASQDGLDYARDSVAGGSGSNSIDCSLYTTDDPGMHPVVMLA